MPFHHFSLDDGAIIRCQALLHDVISARHAIWGDCHRGHIGLILLFDCRLMSLRAKTFHQAYRRWARCLLDVSQPINIAHSTMIR